MAFQGDSVERGLFRETFLVLLFGFVRVLAHGRDELSRKLALSQLWQPLKRCMVVNSVVVSNRSLSLLDLALLLVLLDLLYDINAPIEEILSLPGHLCLLNMLRRALNALSKSFDLGKRTMLSRAEFHCFR